MTTIANIPTAPSHRWLRIGLVLIAALEFLDALSGVQNIFTDHHHDTALLRFAQMLTSIRLALAPVIAGFALIYAALGNVRRAIFALAALVLMVWLLDAVPDIPIHGLSLSFDYGGVESFARSFIFPVAALAAVALTLKDQQTGLAGLLVSLPTLFNWIGVVVFIIAVMIHGF
jgi:hypothetical protein